MKGWRVVGVVVAFAMFVTVLVLFVLSLSGIYVDEGAGRVLGSAADSLSGFGLSGYKGLFVVSVLIDLFLAACVLIAAFAAESAVPKGSRFALGFMTVLGSMQLLAVFSEVKSLAAMVYTAVPRDQYMYLRARELVRPEFILALVLLVAAYAVGSQLGRRQRRPIAGVTNKRIQLTRKR